MRVVVIGGYGNFGNRICRGLSNPEIEVIAAGRTAPKASRVARARHALLDTDAPDFANALKSLAPNVVIHCAGPFQGQDYRVAAATLACGAHYIDLADGRHFVAGFAELHDRAARTAGLLAISGASTVPALSSAVIDSLIVRFQELEEIQIAIAPGQRAPRGAATIAAVCSYTGRRFKWLRGGAWRDAWGWQELRRMQFAGLGTRWAAACDVPDLDLLPARYPSVQTVEFRAALELGMQHFALWFAAALRRAGVPIPLESWAPSLDRLASVMDILGSENGGMLVSLRGMRADGRRVRVDWHLTAEASHGPEIPAMPAILLTRKLARGEIAVRGAYACTGFLALEDFQPEFERWRISTSIQES